MQIDRLLFIERIDQALERGRQKHDSKYRESLAEYRKNVIAWQANQAPRLLANLRPITERLRKGRIVTYQDIQAAAGYGRYGDEHLTFGESEPKPSTMEYKPSSELVSLKRFLEALTDSTVSTSALQAAGWRNMRELLRDVPLTPSQPTA